MVLFSFQKKSQCQSSELATLGFAQFIFWVFALKRTSFRSVIKKLSWATCRKGSKQIWLRNAEYIYILPEDYFSFFSPILLFLYFFLLATAFTVCTQSSFMPQGSNNNSFDPFCTQFKWTFIVCTTHWVFLLIENNKIYFQTFVCRY